MGRTNGQLTKTTVISGDAQEWAAKLSEAFVELSFIQTNPADRLRARMDRYTFGDLTFVRSSTSGGGHVVERTSALIRSSSRNVYFVGCLLAGSATLRQESHSALLEKHDVAILDSSHEYSITVARNIDAVWIAVPRYRLEMRLPMARDLVAERIDGASGPGYIASRLIRSTLREITKIGHVDANRISNSMIDLLGICLNSQLRGEIPKARASDNTLRRIQTYIDENLNDPDLDLAMISARHNLSERYLNKLFRREGVSPGKWIRLRRLEQCRADLEGYAKRELSISEIAFRNGFNNVSSFNRAFRSRYGVSPKALRE